MEVIKIRNLTKSYGDIIAVKDLNISVNEGEIFGLLGANGAGKSTTIECVLGTRTMDNGEVSILGMNPVKERKSLYQDVGVQFQESGYQDKLKVSELCRVTEALYRNPADSKELLRQFGILNKHDTLVSDLSGGQKQRLFIVLALIPNPRVVFLDELTTGLDTRARRDVWDCLMELKKGGLTIFLTSHYMDEIETLCDRVCILRAGTSVFYGSVKEAIDASPFNSMEDTYLWYTEREEDENESI